MKTTNRSNNNHNSGAIILPHHHHHNSTRRSGIHARNRSSIKKKKRFFVCFGIITTLLIVQTIIFYLFIVDDEKKNKNNVASWSRPLVNSILWSEMEYLGLNISVTEIDLIRLEANLAQQVEDELDYFNTEGGGGRSSTSTSSMNATKVNGDRNKKSLDDYYHRYHNRHNSNNNIPKKKKKNESEEGSILIIGDGAIEGSGSRAFAEIVTKLGVPMFFDDRENLDYLVPSAFSKNSYNITTSTTTTNNNDDNRGWQSISAFIMTHLKKSSKTANYEFSSLPEKVQIDAKKMMKQFKEQMDKKFATLSSQNKKDASFSSSSSGIKYAFKTPEAALLLPVFNEIFDGPIKFLHVVRDGREVATTTTTTITTTTNIQNNIGNNHHNNKKILLSSHYNMLYGNNDDNSENISIPLKNIRLWNDMNSQLLQWERNHAATNITDGGGDDNFDYLVMRIEDLLNPKSKFNALLQLAHFVSSTKSSQELCCMSKKALLNSDSVASQAFRKSYLRAQAASVENNNNNNAITTPKNQHDITVSSQSNKQQREKRIKTLLNLRNTQIKNHNYHRNERFKAISSRIEERRAVDLKIINNNNRQPQQRRLQQQLTNNEHENEKKELRRQHHQELVDYIADAATDTDSTTQEHKKLTIDTDTFLEAYQTWRNNLSIAKQEKKVAKDALKFGEILFNEYETKYKDILLGIISEQSFIRSLKYLKSLVDRNNNSGEEKDVTTFSSLHYGNNNDWINKLKDDDDIALFLHEGETALQEFGYYPPEVFMDIDGNNHHERLQCSNMIVCE